MLESDLKMIQAEFKKKNTQIKDVSILHNASLIGLQSCDTALKWLEHRKTNKGSVGDNQPRELLEPLQMIFQSKAVKNYPLAVNCLQKIAQLYTIIEEQITLSVVDMLREATAEPIDEMTQIRVL